MQNDNICRASSDILSRIEDIGRAKSFLKSILDEPIFNCLSKNDMFFQSEHQDECDRLDEIRLTLRCLSDNLWHLLTILNGREE